MNTWNKEVQLIPGVINLYISMKLKTLKTERI